jgi:hypothetical protein
MSDIHLHVADLALFTLEPGFDALEGAAASATLMKSTTDAFQIFRMEDGGKMLADKFLRPES